jgi:hypothetical protein
MLLSRTRTRSAYSLPFFRVAGHSERWTLRQLLPARKS